jgi:hypothetical protein
LGPKEAKTKIDSEQDVSLDDEEEHDSKNGT